MKKLINYNIYLLFFVMVFCSCTLIDEDRCRARYIEYRYLNNIGQNATADYLFKVTDFIFRSDSVLYRVDENITNGKITKRPINLPDGQWIVYSYANLNSGSKVSPYEIGKTRLSDLSVTVITPPSYTGTYAPPAEGEPDLRVGDADRLYFGKVSFNVSQGTTDRLYMVDMSNVHIWLRGTVRFKVTGETPAPPEGGGDDIHKNMHVRLEFVPVKFSFMNDDKRDNVYQIPYSTPRITKDLAIQPIKMQPTTTPNEYTFQMYGLRWEKGMAPVLRLYDGDKLLVTKDLPLNRYFDQQGVDLTYTRVQFFNLLVEVSEDAIVTISNLSLSDWDDGGVLQ